jgi:aldose 1-epimerase
MNIKKIQWGEHQGKTIWLYSIKNEAIEINLTNYGCTIVSIFVSGSLITQEKANEKNIDEKHFYENGLNRKNVILGYSGLEELLADKYYMGSIVGRFAGRISKSYFEINGTKYHLPANDGKSGNHLHGGPHGFNKMIFEEISQHCVDNEASISFHGTSKDMDQGYPGNLQINFSITLNTDNEITFSYLAKADRLTHINLTHHLYYNLGDDTQPATAQSLLIDADSMVETSTDYIPTGKIVPIPQQADFLTNRRIPGDIDFNECYVLNALNPIAAILSDPASGLTMELTTTCPAIIFYSGQFLDKPFYPKQGICLEAQYFPDAPNHKNFPSTLYNEDKLFKEQTKLYFKKII